jgi:predicted TPR repeat methyltransferase
MSSKIKLRKLRFRPPAPASQTTPERLAAAVKAHQEGKTAAAVALYRQILHEEPDQVDALHFLGVAEHQLGHPERALELLGRALALLPDHPDARNNRGNVYKELGRLDEAEADYRHALALRPDDVGARNNLGTVLRQRGDLEAAAATFRTVVTRQPAYAPAWQNLGNVLGQCNQFEEALAAHREAVRLAPQSPDCYRNLGAMLIVVGQIAEATDVYQRWLARFPDDPRAQHFVAACTGNAVPSRASDDYVRAEFNGFAATFDEVLGRLDYRAPALVAEELARLFGGRPSGLDVLDAGCGTGLCGPLLRAAGKRLVGVDLSSAMIELARKREVYDTLVVAELETYLREHPAAFDAIVSADTLVYFGALDAAARAAAQALRPAGVLIFTVEAVSAAEASAGYRINPHGRYSHSEEYLRHVLAEAGFAPPAITRVTLRKEATEWVAGYLIGVRAPPGP